MPIRNDFSQNDTATQAPATYAFAITPHNTTDLERVTRAIYVGGAGNISIRPVGNSAHVDFLGVPAGTILPIRADRVRSTDTTATGIVGLA